MHTQTDVSRLRSRCIRQYPLTAADMSTWNFSNDMILRFCCPPERTVILAWEARSHQAELCHCNYYY